MSELAKLEVIGARICGELTCSTTTPESVALVECLIVDLLHAVLSSRVTLEDLASESYAHPNGFTKVPVFEQGLGERLAIHLWHPSRDPSLRIASQVHDHRWSFVSQVLLGELVHEEYVESDIGEDVVLFSYRSPRGRDAFSLTERGARRLEAVAEARFSRGSRYRLEHDICHRATAVAGSTASIVHQAQPAKENSLVYRSPANQLPCGRVPLKLRSPQQLEGDLRTILDGLAPHSGASRLP